MRTGVLEKQFEIIRFRNLVLPVIVQHIRQSRQRDGGGIGPYRPIPLAFMSFVRYREPGVSLFRRSQSVRRTKPLGAPDESPGRLVSAALLRQMKIPRRISLQFADVG